MSEKLFYDDERNIKISKSMVYAGERKFPLRNIRQIFFRRISTSRRSATLFFLIGVVFILVGSLEIFGSIETGWKISLVSVDSHYVYIGLGVLSMFAGVAAMVFSRDKYIVGIFTENGEEAIVQTDDREYAAKLTGILMKTYHRFIPNSASNRISESVLF